MDYKKILVERFGYNEFEAELVAVDIEELDLESRSILNDFINGKNVDMYGYREYSVSHFQKQFGFNTIAAILAVSNLKKDYTMFSDLYRNGIR